MTALDHGPHQLAGDSPPPATTSPGGAAQRVAALVEDVAGVPLPARLRAWDGSESGPAEAGVTVLLRSRQAVRRLLWAPGELGVARGYVAGDIDVELPAGLTLADAMSDPLVAGFGLAASGRTRHRIRRTAQIAVAAARLGGLGPPGPKPEVEAHLSGRRHGRRRDALAVSHHYDVGNAFYRLLLGDSMVYSCGYWRCDRQPGYRLAEAQRDKLDLVCRKLGLTEGARFLDVGCGWGSLVLHAAAHYGARAVGVTVSSEQAAAARERISAAGLSHLVEVREQDYRDVDDGPYDAIASIGMAEHVGAQKLPAYAEQMWRLLTPGGRLLHHQITSRHPAGRSARGQFIDRYVFPDGELRPVGEVVGCLESAGFEAWDVEALREHYILTLRAWLENLEHGWAAASELASPARARTWRLYLAGSAAAFATGRIGVHQVLAVVPSSDGAPAMPRLRSAWLPY